ncbi:TOMM precursor leader peptide-binding protein [Dactylosporangium sp. CA-139114]|uniref:TOMM precursor leader peptide-binding protein n=1 Tax=Dactylosporangium sp. CA-139114 TaxID=3239931 RepID=UPI003D99CEBA
MYKWNESLRFLDEDGTVSILLADRQTGFVVHGIAAEALAGLRERIPPGDGNRCSTDELTAAVSAELPETEDAAAFVEQLTDAGVFVTEDATVADAAVPVKLTTLNDDPGGIADGLARGTLGKWLTSEEDPVSSGRQLTVVLDFRGDDAGLLDINHRMAVAGRPWLPVRLLDHQVVLGPLSLAGMTSCFRCATDRRYSNTGIPAAFREPVGVTGPAPVGREYHESFAVAAVAAEVKAYGSSPMAPRTLGHVLSFETRALTIARSAVLQSPACDDCRLAVRRLGRRP